jgi:hypothetical protein
VQQLVGHVADAERVFSYRTLSFARGDTSELPGFEQEDWAAGTPAPGVSFADAIADLEAVRHATLTLLRGLPPEAWSRRGVASGNPVSVRALVWIIAGHERHHVGVLRERYLER